MHSLNFIRDWFDKKNRIEAKGCAWHNGGFLFVCLFLPLFKSLKEACLYFFGVREQHNNSALVLAFLYYHQRDLNASLHLEDD